MQEKKENIYVQISYFRFAHIKLKANMILNRFPLFSGNNVI